jgi:hypothetical protein
MENRIINKTNAVLIIGDKKILPYHAIGHGPIIEINSIEEAVELFGTSGFRYFYLDGIN